MLVPQSLGGSETDPETFCRVLEEMSRTDASTGWSVFVSANIGAAAGSLQEDVAWEIFGKRNKGLRSGFYRARSQSFPTASRSGHCG